METPPALKFGGQNEVFPPLFEEFLPNFTKGGGWGSLEPSETVRNDSEGGGESLKGYKMII